MGIILAVIFIKVSENSLRARPITLIGFAVLCCAVLCCAFLSLIDSTLQLYSDSKPYEDESDGTMQECAQYQIFMTLFG